MESFPGNGFIEQLVTGLNTPISDDPFATISPNPFSDELHLNFSNHQNCRVIMFDITNRKVLEQELKWSYQVNTEQLSKGIYIYELSDKNGLFRKGKVVKE
ncbi:MAG: T9SS type A sorting domain-containing protein [Bacteroidetes bacterium]|nr:T9SS type A sorting domain-containing protein [Bacteroidota bacterium]